MRKPAATLDEQRDDLKRRYKHGPRAKRVIVNFDSLDETEKAVKLEAACFLKAAGYPHSYIGEALGTTRGVVSNWFHEIPEMRVRVSEIQADYIDGAVKLLRTYAIELIEMLVNIARTSDDDKVRINAITEALDRMGLAKVNKSESAASVTQKSEVDITDKTGLVESLKDAPPEVQQQAAKHMEELLALSAEHTDRDVTHG